MTKKKRDNSSWTPERRKAHGEKVRARAAERRAAMQAPPVNTPHVEAKTVNGLKERVAKLIAMFKV